MATSEKGSRNRIFFYIAMCTIASYIFYRLSFTHYSAYPINQTEAHTLAHLRSFNDEKTVTCYEWDYLDKNAQSLNFPFDTNINSSKWCDVGAIHVQCHDLDDRLNERTGQYYHSNSYIVCDIESFAKNGDECSTGGATFILTLTAKTSYLYLEGTVIDLFNGRYLGFVHTPSSKQHLEYTLSIRLDFTAFHGSFSCVSQRLPKPNNKGFLRDSKCNINTIILNTMHQQQVNVVVDNTRSSVVAYDKLESYLDEQYGLNNANNNYFVNIYEDQNGNQYAWTKPHQNSTTLEYSYNGLHLDKRNILDQLFHTNKYFQHKWIHFMGKSRTLNYFVKFIEIVLSYHKYTEKDYIFKSSDKYRKNVYYFKDIDLLVTSKSHNIDYDRRSSYFNASSYFGEIVEFIRNTSTIGQHWNLSLYSIPNIYIANKGIHQAEFMRSKQDLFQYKQEVNAYLYNIIQHFEDIKSKLTGNTPYFEKLYVFWRRTTNTHWPQNKLSSHWKCRTQTRVNCLNRLSDGVVKRFKKLYYKHNPLNVTVEILDDYTLSLGRQDCTEDNRHYLKGNCQENMVYSMLNTYLHLVQHT
eukprot:173697_1